MDERYKALFRGAFRPLQCDFVLFLKPALNISESATELRLHDSIIAPLTTFEWLHAYKKQNHPRRHGQQVARDARFDRAQELGG